MTARHDNGRSLTGASSSRRRRSIRGLWTLGVLVVASSFPGLLGASAVQADEGSGVLTRAAQYPLPHGGLEVIVDSSARRAIVPCASPCSATVGSPFATAFDLDTGRVVATGPATETASEFENPALSYALDEAHHELYVPSTFLSTIEVVDTRTLRRLRELPFSANAFQAGISTTAGMAYSPATHLLYLFQQEGPWNLFAIDPQTGATVWSKTVGQQCAPGTAGTPAINMALPLGVSEDGRYAYSVCFSPQSALLSRAIYVLRFTLAKDPKQPPTAVDVYPSVPAGSQFDSLWIPGVDRIAILTQIGNGGWGLVVFDGPTQEFVSAPALYQTPANTTYAYTKPTLGLDPSTGRVYAQARAYTNGSCQKPVDTKDEFAVAETAVARNSSILGLYTGDPSLDAANHMMGFDRLRHNLWILDSVYQPASDCDAVEAKSGIPPKLAVYHDNLPPLHQQGVSDLDAATNDIPEADGVTGVNFGAQASAYGVRYDLGPSGINGPLSSVANSNSSGSALSCNYGDFFGKFYAPFEQDGAPPAPPPPPPPPQYSQFCNSDSRVATMAHVNNLQLDAAEAHAEAIAGDTNKATADDLVHTTDLSQPGPYVDTVAGYANLPASPCPPVTPGSAPTPTPSPGQPPQPTTCEQQIGPLQPYLTGTALPYTPAHCDDFGGGSVWPTPHADQMSFHENPAPANYPGYSEAGCDFLNHKAEAYAEQSGSVGVPIYAAYATAHSLLQRSSDIGTLADSDVTVHDVTVGPYLFIQALHVEGRAWAHGRPGTAGATYTCNVTGMILTFAGRTARYPDSMSCQQAQANIDQFGLDQDLTGILSIRFPVGYDDVAKAPGGQDGVVALHSPGGYLGQVQASQLDQNSTALQMNDHSVEFPGLQVTYYGDTGTTRSRLVVDFGAVAASAKYGIYPLGDINPFPSQPPILNDVPAQVVQAPPIYLPGTPPPPQILTKTKNVKVGGLGLVYQAVVDGVRFFWQHPQFIPALLAVWALFAMPGYLFSRRRSLLSATEVG